MDNSPLVLLSAELGNLIYRLVLTEPYGIVLSIQRNNLVPNPKHGYHYSEETKEVQRHDIPLPSTALLRICQQTRHETMTMYFSLNKLSIDLEFCEGRKAWPSQFMQWVKLVGPEQVQYLHAVEVSVIFTYAEDEGIADCWGGLSQLGSVFHQSAEIDISTWLRHRDNDDLPVCKLLSIRHGTQSQTKECLRKQEMQFRDNSGATWAGILARKLERMVNSIDRMALISSTKDSWICQMGSWRTRERE